MINPSIIETHAHLYSDRYAEDRDAMIQRALDAGVSAFLLPNIDEETLPKMLALCEAYPQSMYPMLGLHPCDVGADFEEKLALLKTYFDTHAFVAIGEFGMDLFHDVTYREQQIEAFHVQATWCLEHQLPAVLHARNANMPLLELLPFYVSKGLRGVFHCFSGTLEEAEMIISMGFYLGIGGVITYKNGGLVPILEQIDLKYLMLETDAPYLPPVPYRGQRNEPAYLVPIAQKLAEVKNCSYEEVLSITSQNAENLFKLKDFNPGRNQSS